MLNIFDQVCTEIMKLEIFQSLVEDDKIHLEKSNIAIKTLPLCMPEDKLFRIRNLKINNINTLICIRGLVLRVSELIPTMTIG